MKEHTAVVAHLPNINVMGEKSARTRPIHTRKLYGSWRTKQQLLFVRARLSSCFCLSGGLD